MRSRAPQGTRASLRASGRGAAVVRAGLPALALIVVAASALACPLQPADGEPIAGDGVSLAWRAEPEPIPVGQHFRLLVVACTAAGGPFPGPIAVDALMPVHRHGMNYRPSIVDGGDGRFAVEGMLFHMPGHWQIVFEAGASPARQRLAADVNVE